MPHNLYLHSALVQSRRLSRADGCSRAIQFNTIDTVVALSVAFLVNAAILFLRQRLYGRTELALERTINFSEDATGSRAHLTLRRCSASRPSTLFAIALLASDKSSTITARSRPWLEASCAGGAAWVRRLLTRLVAICRILVIGIRGDGSVTDLLVLSQVVLPCSSHLQCSLLHFTVRASGWVSSPMAGCFDGGWASCLLITALDIYAYRLGQRLRNRRRIG